MPDCERLKDCPYFEDDMMKEITWDELVLKRYGVFLGNHTVEKKLDI